MEDQSQSKIQGIVSNILNGNLVPEGQTQEGTKIWYPYSEEVRPCCSRALRKLSPHNPRVVYNHCLTIEHLSKKYEVPYSDLKEALREAREKLHV